MTFELGVYSFGNTPRTADGGHGPTAQAIRDVLAAGHLADEVGLDFFGFGEHHTRALDRAPHHPARRGTPSPRLTNPLHQSGGSP